MTPEQAAELHRRMVWNQHFGIVMLAVLVALWVFTFVWRVRSDRLSRRRREASDQAILDNADVNREVRDLLTVVKGILNVTTHQRDQTVRSVAAAVSEVKAAAADAKQAAEVVKAVAAPASESGLTLKTLPPGEPSPGTMR